MASYRFFFSYASETHRASIWESWGKSGNHLEEFFNALCRAVAMETGQAIHDVGYRDQNRLTMSSFWGKELVSALQQSSVLISVISPHYLQSKNCGREIEFFQRRFALRQQQPSVTEPHRIVPIFWMDKATCSEHMAQDVEKLFHDLQLRGHGMPETYPHTGAFRLYTAGDQAGRNSLIEVVAKAIKDLSDIAKMPQLPGTGDFTDLPSFFARKAPSAASTIAAGPKGTNVVYAVATAAEAMQRNVDGMAQRGDPRETWRPFADAPGATVEAATREGLNGADQDDAAYRNLSMPADLITKMEQARSANSPVLIVLDQSSLNVPTIASPLYEYDSRDFPHVGLVTAGGREADEALLDRTMPTKFQQRRANHLWPVPAGRVEFVQGVMDVIGGLRRCLQQTGATAVSLPAGQIPGL